MHCGVVCGDSLRGKRSEGKGKGILGACEARMPRNRRRKEDEGRERLQGRYCIFVIPILLLTVIWWKFPPKVKEILTCVKININSCLLEAALAFPYKISHIKIFPVKRIL